MSLMTISRVGQMFDSRLILEDVTVDVPPRARIGLIGRNGSGKSTLLNILAGMLDPSSGQVDRARGLRVGHQAQELRFAPDATVRGEMLAVFKEGLARDRRLRELEDSLADKPDPGEQRRLLAEYERLQHLHHA